MRKNMLAVVVLSIASLPAAAQQAQAGQQAQAPQKAEAAKQGGDPLARYLYPPDLVMAHQAKLNLTDAQRTAIQQAVIATQMATLASQFKLAAVTEQLTTTLNNPSVDEAAILLLVDQVLAAEREVKRSQVTLLVRIKNQLTAQQQGMLDKLRKQDWTKPSDQ